VLGYYPTGTTNPFQALLYDRALEHGIVPVEIRVERQIDELEALQRSGVATALHLHWLHPVVRAATSAREAGKVAAAFLDRLDRYAKLGGGVIWTVHNVIPHDARFKAAEVALASGVATRADIIHVLSTRTAAAVEPHYHLPPEKILEIPHPSYAGAYPDYVSRLGARQRLHVGGEDLVIVALGAIRPYKGLDTLLDAFARLDQGAPPRRWLVIAGPTTEEAGVAELVERARAQAGVIVDPRKIPQADIQVVLRAADVAVLPYREALNSGALILALTFGVPVIVPAGTGLADDVEATYARIYDPAGPDGLRDALATAHRLATPEARAAALASLAGRDPATISHRFAAAIRERLPASA
jgi:glycosyltransferase involved in cell wall biosynthesis